MCTFRGNCGEAELGESSDKNERLISNIRAYMIRVRAGYISLSRAAWGINSGERARTVDDNIGNFLLFSLSKTPALGFWNAVIPPPGGKLQP
jgi:hypothetical protein